MDGSTMSREEQHSTARETEDAMLLATEPRILIIGAGAAGFSAAARLLEKNFRHITILEAKNRIGGRVHTVEFGENVVELGAQWVHGERGNVTFNMAFQYNLLDSSKLLADNSRHFFVTIKNKIIPNEQGIEIFKIYNNISEKASEELKDADGSSYGQYFTNEFYKLLENNSVIDKSNAEEFLDWIEKFDNSIQCSDSWFDVSAKGITEYWHCEGNSLLNWKDRGYNTIFDLLSRKIPNSSHALPVMQKIEFNKEVSLIDYSENDIVVKTKDGSRYTATHVIFTASLGVLKEKHSTMFVPPLPERKQLAIKGLNIGTVNKIFLEFTHRWWPEETSAFCFMWSKDDQKEFLEKYGQNNCWLCDVFMMCTVDYQPNILCAWIVGKNARYTESLSDTDVRDGLCLLLENFLGKIYNISAPVKMIRSKWYTDEHFRGSYSFRSMTSEQLNVYAEDLAQPLIRPNGQPAVLFAGEATHNHYYSTVHGAVETGFREADRLIHYQRRFKSQL